MIVAGIDLGSLSAKAVILKDNEILSWSVILTTPDSDATASKVLALALKDLSPKDIEYTVSTGYGRFNVAFAGKRVSEISCHARGTNYFFPQVRTILDVGGQDCKAIRCDDKGNVISFIMNDKCAAGSGRFLERIAATLELPLEQIGPLSLEPVCEALTISSFCTVFAENDILTLLRQGKRQSDILSAAHDGLAERLVTQLGRVGITPEFSMSGGVANNEGIVKRLEQRLGMKANRAFEPQIVGAVGAALFARDLLAKRK